MKKSIIMITLIVLLFGIVGCGKTEKKQVTLTNAQLAEVYCEYITDRQFVSYDVEETIDGRIYLNFTGIDNATKTTWHSTTSKGYIETQLKSQKVDYSKAILYLTSKDNDVIRED